MIVGVATSLSLMPVLHQDGHGQALALRQQVGAAGRRRPARGRRAGGDRPRARRPRRIASPACRSCPRSRPMPARQRPSTSTASCATITYAIEPQQGDLQVNLAPKRERHRTSHEIALDVRRRLEGLPVPEGTTVKVVEVPPGPPVIATLLAEIYGPDADQRRAVANEVRAIFRAVPFIVDVDVSFREQAPRLRFDDRPGQPRVPQGRGAGRLRHDRRLPRRHDGRLFAQRRRPAPDRDRRAAPEDGPCHRRADALDAGPRQRAPRRARSSSSATS